MANKHDLKKIARIHAGSLIRNTECIWAFADSGLTEEEIRYLDKQMELLSDQLLQGFEPMSNADDIVKFVLNQK